MIMNHNKMRITCVFYCLLCATLTDGSEITVEGTEGGNVTFLCSHKLAWKYTKYLCIRSCKTNDDILVKVEPGQRAKSGRISLEDYGGGEFSVAFRQLRLTDTGTYWCGVDRFGFDTYTEVQVTVNKAVSSETTVRPDVDPTTHYQNVTQLSTNPTQQSNNVSTNVWTASNFTEEKDQNFTVGIVLCVSIGVVALIIIVMVATRFRKCKKIFKPQPRVHNNSSDGCNVYEKEMTCVYENTEKMQICMSKRTSDCFPAPTTSASNKNCSRNLDVYENVSPSKASTCSPPDDNINDIYIHPLPSLVYENIRPHTMESTICENTKDSTDPEPDPLPDSSSAADE